MSQIERQRVIVIGATGIIGRPLCRSLQSAGYELVVFSRNPETARSLVPGASEYITWQAEERGDWESAVDGAWAVVNMAGAPFFTRWNSATTLRMLTRRKPCAICSHRHPRS